MKVAYQMVFIDVNI